MNETGATVLLRGRGSGYSDGGQGEDVHQPLHLLISSNNSASLERAKLLAENLLDTICAECGASRVSSCKVYGAVPPPPQPVASVLGSGSESEINNIPAANVAALILSSTTTAAVPVTGLVSQGTVPQSLGSLNPVPSQPSTSCYPHQLVTSRTSYIGYDGIYPQATALQQVALALRQSTSPVTATVAPATTGASITSQKSIGSEKDKRPAQKRKFQELPAAGKGQATVNQVISLTLYEANRLIVELCWTFVCFTGFWIWRRHGVAACYFSFMVPMQRYHAPSGFGILSNVYMLKYEMHIINQLCFNY